jgi:hypothetical protein
MVCRVEIVEACQHLVHDLNPIKTAQVMSLADLKAFYLFNPASIRYKPKSWTLMKFAFQPK